MEVERTRLQSQVDTLTLESRQKDGQLRELTGSSTSLKVELESTRAGHEEYKTKVKKVLQEKENLILALREDPGGSGGCESSGAHVIRPQGFEEAELQQAL